MRVLAKMSWLELKLFLREPLTVLFALALPLVVLFVMGGVFGNEAEADFYRGVGAMDYYVPAYLALVIAAVGLISIPTHLASNRERGVLKRFHASSIPAWAVVGAEVAVTFTIASVSALVLIAAAAPSYGVAAPDAPVAVIGGFVLNALAFASIGVLLGAVLPSTRAAQAVGVMAWFVMLMIGGAGPPPEVLTGALGVIGEWTPLRPAIEVMHDGWLSLDAGMAWLAVAAMLFVAAASAIRLFRWE